MKKVFILIYTLSLNFAAFGMMVGTGTSTDPYRGTLDTGPVVWTLSSGESGIVYIGNSSVPDLSIVSGGDLTINPGVILVFMQLTSDLIITGTGRLRALGDHTGYITFTRKTGNSNWGHISFQSMDVNALTSVLDSCIVEWGSKTAASGVDSYGGGLHSNSSNLTISNCIFRNNTAKFGGGVLFFQAKPTFTGCSIISNTATQTGGGLYIYQVTNYSITNCVVENNTCSGGGGGGGIWLDGVENTRIINSTVCNNKHTYGTNKGHNLAIYRSSSYTNPSNYTYGVNSIFWNSNPTYDNGSIWYNLNPKKVTDFINCAFSGSYYSQYTSCIQLNNVNTATNGPNFINPVAGGNYQIAFVSPCRDAGTSTGAPSTDYLGKNRIGNYDIGAYEVQYSRWTGTSSDLWSTAINWDKSVDPLTGTGDVVIPTGLTYYPTGSTIQDFAIEAGDKMIIEPGAKVTLDVLTNNGTLVLESNASGISSLIVNSFSDNDATVELYLTGGNPGAPDYKLHKWHYISTPVDEIVVADIFEPATLHVVGWYDNRVSGTLATGWVAYDGYIYSTGGMGGPTFSTLTPGKGYDYYDSQDNKFTFNGQLNTAEVQMALDFTTPPGSATLNGFNLLGNPFSCGLNWDIISNSLSYPANTSKAVFFTKDNVQYTYSNGVGVPSGATADIPPMQGFFIKTYSTANTLTIPLSAREHNSSTRYKGSSIVPLVRLSITENGVSDETVVRFDELAKYGPDYDFDAVKMFTSTTNTQIYSALGGTNYTINGLPFPETLIEIPIVVNLLTTGNHSISTTQLQGLDNYTVTLTDNTTGFIANLKTIPDLSFSASAGTITDRFVLKVSNVITGTEDPVASKNVFTIYPANNAINIQTIADEWEGKTGSVTVLDLAGKTVSINQNAEFWKNSLIKVPGPGAKGIYIVEIKSGLLRYVGKVVVR